MKKNLKNKIKKMVAGMMLACSLLTLFGGVSSDGIVPYGETVINGEDGDKEGLKQIVEDTSETVANLKKFSEKLNKRFLLFRLMF